MSPATVIAKPRALFLELNSECNLRCKQCMIWRRTDPEWRMTPAERSRVIREFSELSEGQGEVVICGGEPFHTAEDFYRLQSDFAQHKLKYHFVTNGTLFGAADYPRIFSYPPATFTLSLDSHSAEIHDWMRGVPGTFAKVVENIRGVAAYRRQSGKDVFVLVHSIFHNKVLDGISPLLELVQELGADGICFQALMPTFFQAPDSPDWFFENHRPQDPAKIAAAVDQLLEARATGSLVTNTPGEIKYLGQYVAHSGTSLSEPVCGSEKRNLMVDPMGNMKLCFNMQEVAALNPEWNIRTMGLAEFWTSQELAPIRQKMRECKLGCGLQTCHRKEGL